MLFWLFFGPKVGTIRGMGKYSKTKAKEQPLCTTKNYVKNELNYCNTTNFNVLTSSELLYKQVNSITKPMHLAWIGVSFGCIFGKYLLKTLPVHIQHFYLHCSFDVVQTHWFGFGRLGEQNKLIGGGRRGCFPIELSHARSYHCFVVAALYCLGCLGRCQYNRPRE